MTWVRALTWAGAATIAFTGLVGFASGPNIPSPTVFTVTTTADTGSGSLRTAIDGANSNGSNNRITFNIPSAQCTVATSKTTVSACEISLGSPLPTLTADTTTIDGYTQSGASPNTNTSITQGDNAVIAIQVDGSGIGCCPFAGFVVSGADDTVDGVSFTGFPYSCCPVQGALNVSGSGDLVAGDFIGLTPSGTADANYTGLLVSGQGTVGSKVLAGYASDPLGGRTSSATTSSECSYQLVPRPCKTITLVGTVPASRQMRVAARLAVSTIAM